MDSAIGMLKSWFVASALPYWAQHAADHAHGGFYEMIDLSGSPVASPRRARLVARQVYVFATAERRGWLDSGSGLVAHGLDYLNRHMIRDDGSIVPETAPDGTALRATFDLYDTAFVLFALAAVARCADRQGDPEALALHICDRLQADYSHPVAGFEAGQPPTSPLMANPHMHFLETCLAWEEAAVAPARWRALADQIAGLCLSRFIDPETGALHEFFDRDWNRLGGDKAVIEPGHQFEWAWLLLRWAARRGRSDAIAPALRLVELGERLGVDPARNVAFNALDGHLAVADGAARLWPQTERIKAWDAVARGRYAGSDTAAAAASLERAGAGLLLYVEGAPKGLWRETMRPDGGFFDLPARASSLYHLTCAMEALDDRITFTESGSH